MLRLVGVAHQLLDSALVSGSGHDQPDAEPQPDELLAHKQRQSDYGRQTKHDAIARWTCTNDCTVKLRPNHLLLILTIRLPVWNVREMLERGRFFRTFQIANRTLRVSYGGD